MSGRSAILIRAIEESVNERLAIAASDRRVQVQGRNGHWCVDEYRTDGACISLLYAGTKREVADYLQAMLTFADLRRTHS